MKSWNDAYHEIIFFAQPDHAIEFIAQPDHAIVSVLSHYIANYDTHPFFVTLSQLVCSYFIFSIGSWCCIGWLFSISRHEKIPRRIVHSITLKHGPSVGEILLVNSKVMNQFSFLMNPFFFT